MYILARISIILDGMIYIVPFPKRQILEASKLNEYADDIFKFDENGRKFSKRVENTLGKGEIARYEQFLLFPSVFSEGLYCRHVKTRACLAEGLNMSLTVALLH